VQQSITNRLRGTPGRLPPPVDDIENYWTPPEQAEVSARLACSFVGAPKTVRDALIAFIDRTRVDEIMIVSAIYDHEARLRSYELVSQAMLTAQTPQ
jgi:alkanesulfonate monooxygenase SsuD/methylene tetrahydromethanopterin reductase-like flavin-dependent oxidoreductase (luciferase family)